jgi:Predicted transcriptional regulators
MPRSARGRNEPRPPTCSPPIGEEAATNKERRNGCGLPQRSGTLPLLPPACQVTLYAKENTNVIVEITNVFANEDSITNVNSFGDRLRHARKLRGLSQAELARACGISQGAIGNYETDSRRNAKDIFRLADVLGVEAAWLAMGTGPMHRRHRPSNTVAEDPAKQDPPLWPFPDIDPDRIWALTSDQRDVLSEALAGILKAMENSPK